MNTITPVQEAIKSPEQKQNFMGKGATLIKHVALCVLVTLGVQNADEAKNFIHKVKANTEGGIKLGVNYSLEALNAIMDATATDAYAGLADAQKREAEAKQAVDADAKRIADDRQRIAGETKQAEARNVALDEYISTVSKVNEIYIKLRAFGKGEEGAKPLLNELYKCKLKLQSMCSTSVACNAKDQRTIDGIDETFRLMGYTPQGTLISNRE